MISLHSLLRGKDGLFEPGATGGNGQNVVNTDEAIRGKEQCGIHFSKSD